MIGTSHKNNERFINIQPHYVSQLRTFSTFARSTFKPELHNFQDYAMVLDNISSCHLEHNDDLCLVRTSETPADACL